MLVDLPAVIKSYIKKFETQLFTSLPATVVSFNSEEQTVSVKPVMLEAYLDGGSSEFPVIDDVPVVFPSAGGGSLTFPIKVGDEVLLQFSSRNYDTWWSNSETKQLPSTQRYNDLTDAIAIVGLTSKNNSVQANTEDVEIKFNDENKEFLNRITLKKDGAIEIVNENSNVTLASDGTISSTNENGSNIILADGTMELVVADTIAITNSQEELISVLSDALQAVADITTNTIYGTSPINNKPDVLAIKAKLDTFKK